MLLDTVHFKHIPDPNHTQCQTTEAEKLVVIEAPKQGYGFLSLVYAIKYVKIKTANIDIQLQQKLSTAKSKHGQVQSPCK